MHVIHDLALYGVIYPAIGLQLGWRRPRSRLVRLRLYRIMRAMVLPEALAWLVLAAIEPLTPVPAASITLKVIYAGIGLLLLWAWYHNGDDDDFWRSVGRKVRDALTFPVRVPSGQGA